MIVSVREAKATLSKLLDAAAGGEEIIITCDGKPKARLVPLKQDSVPFRVNWTLLKGTSKRGTTTTVLVRQDRDERG